MALLFKPDWERTSAPSNHRLMERESRLRETLVGRLERSGTVASRRIAAAFRAVPRHRFVPSVEPDEAYADRAIALKTRDGDVVSSISQPSMLAQMLDLLDPQPGDSILEIGGGSGYNAALIAELVGASGRVVTVELDAEIADAARHTLAGLGYDNVRVLAGDGFGPVDTPPVDRIVVSARSDDVAAAWWDALPEGGRIVVPLRLEGAGEFAIGFERRGRRLKGIGAHPCAFVAMRGAGIASGGGGVFHRDPSRSRIALVRGVASIEAVRTADATPDMLREVDLVVARPVTVFGVRFFARAP